MANISSINGNPIVIDPSTGIPSNSIDDSKLKQTGVLSRVSDLGEKIDSGIIRLTFEEGRYDFTTGELTKIDSPWYRRTNVVEVEAYSSFIITSDKMRGYVFVSTDGVTFTPYNWITDTDRRYIPQSNCYVAFVMTNTSGNEAPTVQECHDWFYILPPYEINSARELESYDKQLRMKLASLMTSKFTYGGLSSGVVSTLNKNRIVFVELMEYQYDIIIKIASGFRAGVHYFNDGEFSSDSGWRTGSLKINAGQQFKMIVARTSEQTETDGMWWVDFVRAVTVNTKTLLEDNNSINNKLMFSARARLMLHRGLSSEAPENSVPSFRLAGQASAWGIETDVYETSDGYFVCMHDDTVDRTTDGTGSVRDKTLAQIRSLRIDEGANIEQYPNLQVPTFEEYLQICKTYGCVAFIEVKGVDDIQSLYDTIVNYGMLYMSVFILWHGDIPRVRNIDTDAVIPCLINGYSSDDYSTILDRAKPYQNMMVGLQISDNLTQEIIFDAHQNGIAVGCWTVDNESEIISYFEQGIDLVTSNSVTALTA